MKNYLMLILLFACTFNLSASSEPPVQILKLSYLNLKTIDLDSSKAVHLIDIDLSGNPISILPSSLAYAKNLKVIRLNSCSNIDLDKLVSVLIKFPIEELEMNNCGLTYLPIELSGIKTLKKISLKNNALQDLPWNLFYNENLEYLNLENNGVIKLEKGISKLTNLRYLNVSGNPCINEKKFWENISPLNNLTVLACNDLNEIPSSISLPSTLLELTMDNLKAEFPKKISGIANLKKLSLLNYNQTDIKQFIIPLINTGLTHLSISGTSVSCLPDSFATLNSLEFLSIDAFFLKSACYLGNLKTLKEVKLKLYDSTSVLLFIQALGTNSTIEELNLSGNNFKTIPKEINSLQNLQKLIIKNTPIETITNIQSLKNLRDFDLRGNKKLSPTELDSFANENPTLTLLYDRIPEKSGNVSFITKPFPNLTLEPQLFSINAKRDTLLKADNGTIIFIPANSIVDKKNKAVTQAVKLSYTTYYDPLEVFASGIPMTADSAGIKKSFASAGMFTLNASFGNNQTAYVKKGKEITVDFQSNSPNKSYNYYYLDTITKNWIQTGKDSIDDSKNIKMNFTKRRATPPKDPYSVRYSKLSVNCEEKKAGKKKPRFKLSASYNKKQKETDSIIYNPIELSAYSHIQWEYVGSDPKKFYTLFEKEKYFKELSANRARDKSIIDYSSASVDGIEVKITPDIANDNYRMVFYSPSDSFVVEVIPVIKENNPEKIQKKNKELYFKYAAHYNDNETNRDMRLKNFQRQYLLYKTSMENYSKLMKAFNNPMVSAQQYNKMLEEFNKRELDSLSTLAVTKESISRSMALTGFGTYNCDYFSRVDNPIVSSPIFYDKDTDKKLNVKSVTLIDLKENAYIECKPSDVKMRANTDYWIFTQSGNGTVGFATIPATNKDLPSIKIKEVKANSIQELREQLKY